MLRLMKTLRLAGLAAALCGGSAFAADIIHAPPPPLVAAPAPLEVGSGFYLRGDVGIGIHDYATLDTVPPLAGLRTLNSSVDSAVFVGGGVGYQFNSFLRADLTGEYRFDASHRHVDVFPGGSNLITGKVGGFVGLANVYVDLGTWHRITPFIGGGVGFSALSMGRTADYQLGAGGALGGTGPSRSQTNFAWAIHAGLGYDLTSNLKAEVAYRYLNLGTVEGGTVTCFVACTPFRVRLKDLQSHDIKVGLRYVFADSPAAYVPGPLIRKY
ncbi:MAG: porin [Methylobacterium sp.]|nr:MAG: porin [Methylobacterium sp.]